MILASNMLNVENVGKDVGKHAGWSRDFSFRPSCQLPALPSLSFFFCRNRINNVTMTVKDGFVNILKNIWISTWYLANA